MAGAGAGSGHSLSHCVSCVPPSVQFEFMIESILYARDAWLKEDGGHLGPTTAALHLVPCSADRDYTAARCSSGTTPMSSTSALSSECGAPGLQGMNPKPDPDIGECPQAAWAPGLWDRSRGPDPNLSGALRRTWGSGLQGHRPQS